MEYNPLVSLIQKQSRFYKFMSKCLVTYPLWTKLLELNPSLPQKISWRRRYRLYFPLKLKIKLPTKSLSRHTPLLIRQTHPQLNQTRTVHIPCHPQILLMFWFRQVNQLIVVLLNWREFSILGVINKNTSAIMLYFFVKTEIFYISSWKLSYHTSIMLASSSKFMNVARGFYSDEPSSVSSVGRQ